MKVIAVLIIVGAHGTISKDLKNIPAYWILEHYHYYHASFSHQFLSVVSHWSLSMSLEQQNPLNAQLLLLFLLLINTDLSLWSGLSSSFVSLSSREFYAFLFLRHILISEYIPFVDMINFFFSSLMPGGSYFSPSCA